MADLASQLGVSIEYIEYIEYIDVTYTFHLSNGGTKAYTLKTYACPRCSTPMLNAVRSPHPTNPAQSIASFVCPRCDYENVRIEDAQTAREGEGWR